MNDIIRTSVTIYVTYLFFFACMNITDGQAHPIR